ncbi:MAG: purine-nucleoside phosphorylase [Desulfurococcales archaeon]|nr:purine-nucleoside phosphorylase [Desulfurococcales archaeon]
MIGKPIHLKIKPENVAKRVVVAGDPARVEQVSKLLEKVRLINKNRGFITYTGEYKGVPITVATHGVGFPSAGIVFEELAMVGAKAIVRLGSCGALVKGFKIGDLIIPTGCAYYPGGAYYQYLGEYVCTATSPDYEMLKSLVESAHSLGVRYSLGPVISSDAFYAEDPEFAKRWASRGILAVEMECAGLFMFGLMRKVRTAAVLLVSDSLVEDLGFASAEELREYALKAAEVALEALIKTQI